MSIHTYIYCTHTNAIHEDANVYRYPARHMRMDTILGAMTLLQHARSRHPRRRHGSQRAGLLWGLRRSRRAEAQGQVSLFLSELSGHLNSLLMSWSKHNLLDHPSSHPRASAEARGRRNTHTTPWKHTHDEVKQERIQEKKTCMNTHSESDQNGILAARAVKSITKST